MPLLGLDTVEPNITTPTAQRPLYGEEGAAPSLAIDNPAPPAEPKAKESAGGLADIVSVPYNFARAVGHEAYSTLVEGKIAGETPQTQSLDRAFDTIGAVLRGTSYGGAAAAVWRARSVNNDPQPGYNAFEDIKGTSYEARWSNFVDSNNPAHTDMLRQKIDAENEDSRTLDAAGAGGVVASLAAGLTDPLWLIPVAGELKGGELAYRVGVRAFRTSLAATASATAVEGVLHAAQETRSWEDSAITIGSSALLGGLLGGAFGFMSKGEVASAKQSLGNLTHPDADIPWGPSGPSSGGAAAVAKPTIEDLTIAGTAANKLASVTSELNPNLRANFRASPAARQFSQELAENTLYQGMHSEGRSLGPAVETIARSTYNARLFDSVSQHEDLFKEFKRNGGDMSSAQFENAVGDALRSGDVSDNPHVQRAAESWRQRMFEPFKNEAIEQGLLPENVDVSTAPSYFMRLWNRQVLTAHEPAFKERVTDHYDGVMQQTFATDTDRLSSRTAALDQEAADLNITPDQRMKTLDTLEAQGKTLDEANPQHVSAISDINEARARARAAKDAGDVPGEAAARKQAKDLYDQGGQGLQDYLKQRTALRSRFRRVDLNYAGIAERVDKTIQQIADTEDANVRSIDRVVQRGRKFERDLQKMDPEKVDAKRAELRDAFSDLADKADKSAERLQAQLDKLAENEKLGPGAKDAKSQALLERAHKTEMARADRLSSISQRLEVAESLDPEGRMLELRRAVDDLVAETSQRTLGRGERVARLKEKLDKLDPKTLDTRAKAIEEMKKRITRDYYDKWEVQHLGQGLDTANPSFRDAAAQIADDVFDKLTGRAQTDSSSVLPEYLTPITRGPLKDRTFNIPDEKVKEFLESNVKTVAERYGRTMASEIELTRRFGHADMRDQLGAMTREYADLRAQVTAAKTDKAAWAIAGKQTGVADKISLNGQPTKEKILKWLEADEKGAKQDLTAMRDLIRGTYMATQNASNYGRVVRSLMAFNYVRSMGGVLVANIGEVFRPAMVHGLGAYMNEGIKPLLTNLAAVKLSVKEAQLAGQVIERVTQQRMMSLGEIGDPYRHGTAIERTLQTATRVGSKWNGLVFWTDGMKSISSILSQNRIVAGALGKGDDTRFLAYLGIDKDMSGRIAEQFKTHGETMDSIHVANTQDWTDAAAVRAYRAAVSKDVDSIIVTKSVGDVPLFANTPTGKMLLQFRNYTFAAHQRILLRGLQENKVRFAGGMMAMTAMGMMGAYARAWRGGEARFEAFKDAAQNPGYLIGEGLDAAGVFTLPMEASNDIEKWTGAAGVGSFNPIKTPLKMAFPGAPQGGRSVRSANQDWLSPILGPTESLGADALRGVGYGPAALGLTAQGSAPKSQKNAALRMIPFSSYLGVREMLQGLAGDSPYGN
jgi:hypothetical protein